MARRCPVKLQPGNQPEETERAGDHERSRPTVMLHEVNDQRRGNNRADERSAVKEACGQRPFLQGEPLADDLHPTRIRAALAESQNKAQKAELHHGPRERMQGAGGGPADDDDGKAETRAETVEHGADGDLAHCHAEEEAEKYGAVLSVGEFELLAQHGCNEGEHLTVEDVDGDGEEQHQQDPPADAVRRAHRGNCLYSQKGSPSARFLCRKSALISRPRPGSVGTVSSPLRTAGGLRAAIPSM